MQRRIAVNLMLCLWAAVGAVKVTAAVTAADVTVSINPSVSHPISPYVYGINSASEIKDAPAGLTLNRAGGNRWTAYNWVNNLSNAGSDYNYQNDAYLSSSSVPLAAVADRIAADQLAGMASLITVQMQGLVAADSAGPVSVAHPPDVTRFKRVIFQKTPSSPATFTATPPASEDAVYMDEFLWALDRKFPDRKMFGDRPAAPPVFAELDNEPELWNSTHLEVQTSSRVTSDAYITKTIALATALKKQFPKLITFGPAHFGFYGMYAWNGELSPTPAGKNWFTDKYLAALRTAGGTFGVPLVDVYDFHWYSEATDSKGARVVGLNGPSLTDDQIQAIVQSPRSLWDATFRENSWITKALGAPINILSRLRSRISSENPGMKLAMTEYSNGGAQHIAGTIAQADNLGIFGAQDLFAATFWQQTPSPYILAGYSAFRDFDGAHHDFGDVSAQATSSDPEKVSAYVSTDSARPGRVVIVAINRSSSRLVAAFDGQPLSGTAHLFEMTAASAKGQRPIRPVPAGSLSVSGSSLALTLPAYSVTTADVY